MEPDDPRLQTLGRRIERLLVEDGDCATAIDGLYFGRSSAPTRPMHAAQWPCITIVIQGRKSLTLGDAVFNYGPGEFVLVALDVPTASRVVSASATEPYLGLAIAIDLVRLNSLLRRTPVPMPAAPAGETKAVSVAPLPEGLFDAVARIAALLDTPSDIAALAPLLYEEILYRLLRGPEGWRLIQIATEESAANRIAKGIAMLKANFAKGLKVEALAREASMSPSSFHQHFRAVTGLTPIQYQKSLRLMEARRLMMVDRLDAGAAGFEVGYQSASQFSRDYRRQYGAPPRASLSADLQMG